MRLIKARVRGYRSIKDTGDFEIEKLKTIFVGPNEAGKTAVLQALQQLNPPTGVKPFSPLRDYPRSKYDEDIVSRNINPATFTVVEGYFSLSDAEKVDIPKEYKEVVYVLGRYLDNKAWHRLDNCPASPSYGDIEKDFLRLNAHIAKNFRATNDLTSDSPVPLIDEFTALIQSLNKYSPLQESVATKICQWLDKCVEYIDEGSAEDERYSKLKSILVIPETKEAILKKCDLLIPKFVLFNNYFRVKPSIHLEHLAQRIKSGTLDDDQYDYGNTCLLKLLGFTAEELSAAGKAAPANSTAEEVQKYKDKLDDRNYRLNAASIRLTEEITRVWNPNPAKPEANKLRLEADGQYLKVVVEDSLGVEVELDQRSEGFQWLVSFFVVFFSEASDKHKNAVLLLDEPGMSLHGLKQTEFRETLSRLSENNQTIFTTHSPFLVGANELDIVRVVEMPARELGTIVHTSVTASDSAALLPLQEALGYDLAQSLFIHQKNLVLEGLTDYWYIEAMSSLLGEAGKPTLDDKIALNPANCASKVVYYATILHAQRLKVAALLDSDAEGDNAAQQDILVNSLGNKRILRTKDVYVGDVAKPEIEDLYRDTLIEIAKTDLGWDVSSVAITQAKRPIVDVFTTNIKDFSKYKLAKQFLRWTKDHSFSDLKPVEQEHSRKLIERINNSLK